MAWRWGYGGSALLIASGFLYTLLWLVAGETWEGPTSMRKPILFGLSTGVTLLSVLQVWRNLRPRRFDGWLIGGLTLALVLEVGLIDLQQARGVPSHFNRSTALDAVITDAMGVLILAATAVLVDVTVRAHRSIQAPADRAFAARRGMLLLLLGCGLGVVITAVGEAQAARGMPPETYGAAGVLKFPHGLPLHAIQIFQLQVWALGAWPMARRLAVLRASAWLVLGSTLYGWVQTFGGFPRFPPSGLGAAVALGVGIGLIGLLWRDRAAWRPTV